MYPPIYQSESLQLLLRSFCWLALTCLCPVLHPPGAEPRQHSPLFNHACSMIMLLSLQALLRPGASLASGRRTCCEWALRCATSAGLGWDPRARGRRLGLRNAPFAGMIKSHSLPACCQRPSLLLVLGPRAVRDLPASQHGTIMKAASQHADNNCPPPLRPAQLLGPAGADGRVHHHPALQRRHRGRNDSLGEAAPLVLVVIFFSY